MKYDFDTVHERRGTNCVKYENDRTVCDSALFPMWVADMDFQVLPEIREALKNRAEHGIFGYGHVSDAYRQAVAGWMQRRHHFEVKPEWIVVTAGVVTAIGQAVLTFTQPDDAILVLKPVYYPFDRQVLDNGRRLVVSELQLQDGHYEIDFEDLEKQLRDNDVKMIILSNPHNPVGRVFTRDELQKIGDLAKKYGVLVISDEIHMDFVYPGHEHVAFTEVDPSFKDFTIVATAASKTFNLAALATSNIIIPSDELREAYAATIKAHGSGASNIFGWDATQAAYTYGDAWVDELLEYLQGNIAYMKEYLAENIPEAKMIEPEGLYLVWVDFRGLGMDEKELEDFMLHKAHLYLDEGYIFGQGGEGFERFNLALPRCELKRALEQLGNAVKDWRAEKAAGV